MLVCVFSAHIARETAGAARIRLSLRPLLSRAEDFSTTRAYHAAGTRIRILAPSLRATGSRECAPDDRLREAIHCAAQRKYGLLRCARNDVDKSVPLPAVV